MADSIQHLEQIANGVEANGALTKLGTVQDFGGEVVGDHDAFTGGQLAAGTDESLPGKTVGGNRFGEEDLDAAGCILVMALAMSVESRGENAGVVEDEAVAGMKEGRKIAEHAIFPLAGGAVHYKHA